MLSHGSVMGVPGTCRLPLVSCGLCGSYMCVAFRCVAFRCVGCRLGRVAANVVCMLME